MDSKPNDETSLQIERALRLGELRKEVMDRVGGPFLEGGTAGLPMELQTRFWEHVLAFESWKEATLLERLRNEAGFTPRPPEQLGNSADLNRELWRLIEALASIRVFLSFTDHLDDRELYRRLVEQSLADSDRVPPAGSAWNCTIDMTDAPTPDDPGGIQTWLRFYADELDRELWEDGDLPPRESPPHDRDRFLPVPPEEGNDVPPQLPF